MSVDAKVLAELKALYALTRGPYLNKAAEVKACNVFLGFLADNAPDIIAAVEEAERMRKLYIAARDDADLAWTFQEHGGFQLWGLWKTAREKRLSLAALSPAPAAMKHEEVSDDANVEAVRAMLLGRSRRGVSKYGVTAERTDLSMRDWLTHLQEELLDGAVYIQAAINSLAPAASWVCPCGYMMTGGVCRKCGQPAPAKADGGGA